MDKNGLFVVGSGGHLRSLMPLIKAQGYLLLGIYDDSFDPAKPELINGCKLSGKIADLPERGNIVLSVGDNKTRALLYNLFTQRVVTDNFIHASASVEDTVRSGFSNQIFAKTCINSSADLGVNNIINTGSIIEHETRIGSHNHVSVGAILCGRVIVGDRCFIGAGAVVIDKISICNDVIIGASSVVVDNIREPGTYVGNPARRIK